MKFAFMTFSTPGLTLDENLDLVKQLGYDGLELRISVEHKHGVEFDTDAAARAVARRKSEDAGVPYCCVATSCSYADPAITQQSVDDTRCAVDLAADIGCDRLRVFGGLYPDATSRQEAVDRVVTSLTSLTGHAQSRNVVITVETHDAWCDPDDMAAVMAKVDHPSIAVNWDIMHPVHRGGKTMQQAFDILGPWIRHVHVHDGVMLDDGSCELRTIDEGTVDHGAALRLLHGMGYDGYVSGEWINWEPHEAHLPRELAALRELERNLGV